MNFQLYFIDKDMLCGLLLSQYQGIERLSKVVYMMIDPLSATSMKVS